MGRSPVSSIIQCLRRAKTQHAYTYIKKSRRARFIPFVPLSSRSIFSFGSVFRTAVCITIALLCMPLEQRAVTLSFLYMKAEPPKSAHSEKLGGPDYENYLPSRLPRVMSNNSGSRRRKWSETNAPPFCFIVIWAYHSRHTHVSRAFAKKSDVSGRTQLNQQIVVPTSICLPNGRSTIYIQITCRKFKIYCV